MAEQLHVPYKFRPFQVDREVNDILEQALRRFGDLNEESLAEILRALERRRDRRDLQSWLEIERWATRQVGDTLNTGGYDAIVDGSLTTSNTLTRNFPTVFAAVQYLADTLGLVSMSIGVLAGRTVTETANYAGTTGSLKVRLALVGSTVVDSSNGLASSGGTTWALAGFKELSKWSLLVVDGLYVTTTATTTWFTSAGITVQSRNSSWIGNSNAPSFPTMYADSSWFRDCSFSAVIAAWGTTFYFNTVTTTASWAAVVQLQACTFIGPTATNLTLTLSTTGYIYIDGFETISSDVGGQSTSNGNIVQLNITNTASLYIDSGTPLYSSTSAGNGFFVNITSANLRNCVLMGWFYELIVPALTGNNKGSLINAKVYNRADITGPAHVNLSLGIGSNPSTYGVRVRGSGVTGTIASSFADHASLAGTIFDFISATRCVLSLSAPRNGALSATVKVYNLDAGSSHNILILEADAFGGTSADAGTADLIITDAGAPPGGAAGGSLAGTYPNPSFAGRDASVDKLNQDMTQDYAAPLNGVVSFPTPTIAGAAGGSLAGTYPNPTFAGRDASVDKLNQDMTQVFLCMGS